ncbi:MAG: iron chaperone [Erysipelothrix sp.]|nr:iron chaperone [Erysipelothrix sp.]
MDKVKQFLSTIEDTTKRKRFESIIKSIHESFIHLDMDVKWNQPMFIDQGTFIMAFSVAKAHLAVAPEAAVIQQFKDEIEKAGYSYTQELFRIKWSDEVDLELLKRIVAYNIETKKNHSKFWR